MPNVNPIIHVKFVATQMQRRQMELIDSASMAGMLTLMQGPAVYVRICVLHEHSTTTVPLATLGLLVLPTANALVLHKRTKAVQHDNHAHMDVSLVLLPHEMVALAKWYIM